MNKSIVKNKDNLKNNIIELKINEEENVVVNYTCYCKKNFGSSQKLLYVLPCCHMIHETCFNKFILDSQYQNLYNKKNNLNLNCPMCSNLITCVLTEDKIKSKLKYRQYKIDMESVKLDASSIINYMILPFSLVKFTSFINKLILIESHDQIIECIEFLFQSFGIKINIIDNTKKNPFFVKDNTIIWKNKKDNKAKTVIISNHSNYLDSFIYFIYLNVVL